MFEIGPREMIIALGALVALATLLQIFRGLRNSRYQSIQMPNKKTTTPDSEQEEERGDLESEDDAQSEFPSGRARVVSRNSGTLDETNEIDSDHLKLEAKLNRSYQPNLDLRSSEIKKNEKSLPKNINVSKKYLTTSIVVLHVVSKENSVFEGEKLMNIFLEHGLRYGAKKIFHYYDGAAGSGSIIFSIANSINPGTFDLDQMPQLTTPSISLFFAMEDHKNPMDGLNSLLDTAKKIAIELNGDLKDDSRSAFTRQTEEHYRQRVVDYSRAKISGI